MTTMNNSLHNSAHAHPLAGQRAAGDEARLHRLKTVRLREGLSRRRVARRLGIRVSEVERQEAEAVDLRISTIHKWSAVLDVPIGELLEDPPSRLSTATDTRAQLVRVMKSAKSIREKTNQEPIRRMAETLIGHLIQLMPELDEVGGWHSVGQRRSEQELGRAAERTLPDQIFGDPLDSEST